MTNDCCLGINCTCDREHTYLVLMDCIPNANVSEAYQSACELACEHDCVDTQNYGILFFRFAKSNNAGSFLGAVALEDYFQDASLEKVRLEDAEDAMDWGCEYINSCDRIE